MSGTLSLFPRLISPPLWKESRALVEGIRAIASPLPARLPVPAAGGDPVLLIPGFLAGDASLRLLAGFLANLGYEPSPSGIRCNVDCSAAAVGRLEHLLEDLARASGPVKIVGHSRGGLFARVLAKRRPELVRGVVTLGSPQRDMLAVHPLIWAHALTLAVLAAAGVPGLLGFGCARGSCCEGFRHDLGAPLPRSVPVVSMYSRTDGVVDWRTCLDPRARNVELGTTHVGMVAGGEALAEVAGALAGFDAARVSPRSAPGLRLAA